MESRAGRENNTMVKSRNLDLDSSSDATTSQLWDLRLLRAEFLSFKKKKGGGEGGITQILYV